MPQIKPYFGMNLNLKPGCTFPCLVPFGSYRFWDDDCYWAQINEQLGTFNFTSVDYWIKELQAIGVNDGLFVLGGPPPDYANANMQNPVPKSLNTDGTGTNVYWRQWVAAISSHFSETKFKISGYEIWNEFNNPLRWGGTAQQMLRLAEDVRCIVGGRGRVTATQETVSQVLESVGLRTPTSPSSVILSPSAYSGQERLIEYLSLPAAKIVTEAIEQHSYKRTPQDSLLEITQMRTDLTRLRVEVPIWLGECSWAVRNNDLTDSEKAAWVQTIYTSALGQVARVYWYAGNNGAAASGPPNPESTGLLYSGGKLTACGESYVKTVKTLETIEEI